MFKIGIDDFPRKSIQCVGHDLDLPPQFGRNRGNDGIFLINRLQLALDGVDLPDVPLGHVDEIIRRSLESDFSQVQQRHVLARAGDISDDVRRQDDDDVPLAHVGQQIPEPNPFFRVETRRRLVHNHNLRVADQRLSNPQPAFHTAGKLTRLPIPRFVQPDLFQHLIHRFFSDSAVFQPGKTGHVIQKLPRRQFLKKSKILRQIAQHRPNRTTVLL